MRDIGKGDGMGKKWEGEGRDELRKEIDEEVGIRGRGEEWRGMEKKSGRKGSRGWERNKVEEKKVEIRRDIGRK